MPQILASGKTGSQRYEDLEPTKPCPDLDDITLIQNFQNAYEETQGYSLCNNKGNTDSIDTDLDDITLANVSTYNKNLAQLIQTYVANGSYLDVDPTSTANNIILVPRKIADINSPNGNNYAKATSLPFTYRDNLRFAFRATADNSGSTQFSITGLSGLVGAKDLVDEQGSNLVGGEIIAGRFYEIVLTGTGGTQKGVLVGTNRVVAASTTASGIVELLTNAELAAGTDTTRAATAAAIASLFGTSNRSASGYARLPVKVGGAFVEIIIQWGTSGTIGAESILAITLPLTFPTAILSAIASGAVRQIGGAGNANSIQAEKTSKSKITLAASNYAQTANWIAIGY